MKTYLLVHGARLRADAGWRPVEIESGHEVMVAHREALLDVLLDA